MGNQHTRGDQWFVAVTGALVLLVSVVGMVHAARAACAAGAYYAATYGVARPSPETVLDLAQRSYRQYPWNYYFSIQAAEIAYRQSEGASTNAVDWLQKSQWWCQRGLAQNPYKSQLRRLQTRFLLAESPVRAIPYWAAYTDWNYWEAYNHATLAELCAEGGDFDRADRELKLIERFPDYGPAKERVDRQRKTWEAMMRGDFEEWGE